MPRPTPNKPSMSPRDAAVLGLGFVLGFYFVITETGPYAWFAGLQPRWMGASFGKLTSLFVLLTMVGLVALVSLPLKYLFPAGGTTPVGRLIGGIGARLLTGRGLCVLMGLAVAAAGAREYHRATGAGPLTPLEVAQLEAGRPPQSSWVRAHGYAVTDAAIPYRKPRSRDYLYTPVVSRANDIRQTGIHLFIKSLPSNPVPSDPEHPGEYEGLLTAADLPGPVRANLEQRSLLRGTQYYVLELGLTPARQKDHAKFLLLLGIGVTAAALLFSVVYAFGPRRT